MKFKNFFFASFFFIKKKEAAGGRPHPRRGVKFTMNMNQFTQKSLESIQAAQNIATQYGNQQVEQPHLMLALVDQEGGFIPQLLTHMGLTLESFRAAARHEVEILPKVSGSGREAGKVYIAPGVDKALNQALAIAGNMKDEFVSVEHILLALMDTAEEIGRAHV